VDRSPSVADLGWFKSQFVEGVPGPSGIVHVSETGLTANREFCLKIIQAY
ncbi:hypothetical protein chiPu_0016211, partial [Chiloscyllium punctatum]|nr:hypothetical protein [Chiloscyllium punctatum]